MGADSFLIDFEGAKPRPGALDVRWIHGSPSAKHNADPDIQVHGYDEHTFILHPPAEHGDRLRSAVLVSVVRQ
ncbi:hypothetical protein ACIRUL_14865 [Streptomyces sp. NPDC101171]|uniref:hypothetical protein n=1 Tax=Streptomyces sp. NPDC101171 TaxID=3366122 RepID=UPI003812796D